VNSIINIIVFSDSHGNTEPMNEAVLRFKPDMIIHLGDHAWDADCFTHRETSVRHVRGNCDYGSAVRETDTVVLPQGIKVVMTHGHLYSVKTGLQPILNMGRVAGADILLFGHTHRALCERWGDMLVMNPGTAGVGKGLTCGLLHINGIEFKGEIVSL